MLAKSRATAKGEYCILILNDNWRLWGSTTDSLGMDPLHVIGFWRSE